MIPGTNISSRIDSLETGRPFAEVLVEGELSPFEHEALYKLLEKKHLRPEEQAYSELLDETIGSRVNILFIILTSPLAGGPCSNVETRPD